DAELIWKLHGGDPRVRFYNDQPSLTKSVQNALNDAETNLVQTRGVLTVDVKELFQGDNANRKESEPGPAMDEPRWELLRDIEALAVRTDGPVTWKEFLRILNDEETKQLVLFTRMESGSLVFADQRISLYYIKEALRRLEQDKELVYIVANHG